MEAADGDEGEADDSHESQDHRVSAPVFDHDPLARALDDLDAEAAAEPQPEAEVPSVRGFGEGRRIILKRRAEVFSRSTCETFAFVTSKTLSQKDARDVLETFCNVSLPRHFGNSDSFFNYL